MPPPRHLKKPNDRSTPIPITTSDPVPQGFSSKIFGLLKKIPMAMGSPTKDTHESDEDVEEEEEESEMSDEGEEESEGLSEREEDLDQNHELESLDQMEIEEADEEEEEEEEEEDEEEEEEGMGNEQYQAIMENYLLETSTRTNLLMSRIRTQFKPALRRRFAFELSRITPSISQVTAREYHDRDQGVLRNTMEYVARLAVEQKGYQIGMKRHQSVEEIGMSEREATFRKRKRVLTNNSHSTTASSSHRRSKTADRNPSADGRPGSVNSLGPSGTTSKRQSRTKPPVAHSAPVSLNSRLPPTPVLGTSSKAARLPRRNESLISINGSPVMVTREEGVTGAEAGMVPSSEFTFVKTSKWAELEQEVNRLEIGAQERQKLSEMLKSLKMNT